MEYKILKVTVKFIKNGISVSYCKSVQTVDDIADFMVGVYERVEWKEIVILAKTISGKWLSVHIKRVQIENLTITDYNRKASA